MSGLVKVNTKDRVYEAVDANLTGGTVVVPSATATESGAQGIKAAGAAAVNVLGVASKDCVTAANRAALESGNGPAPANYPFVDATVPTATCTVYNDGWFKLEYVAAAAAIEPGDRVMAAAGGKLEKWDGTTAGANIGWAAEAVGTGGGFALTRILV